MEVTLVHVRRWDGRASHYLTSLRPLPRRLHRYVSGCGARLMTVVGSKGAVFVPARVWLAPRNVERSIEGENRPPVLCPICRGEISVHEVRGMMSVCRVSTGELAARLETSRERVLALRHSGDIGEFSIEEWLDAIGVRVAARLRRANATVYATHGM